MKKGRANKKNSTEMECKAEELLVEELDGDSKMLSEQSADAEENVSALAEETVAEVVEEAVETAVEVQEETAEEAAAEAVEETAETAAEVQEAVAEEAAVEEAVETVEEEAVVEEEVVASAVNTAEKTDFISRAKMKISYKIMALCMVPTLVVSLLIMILSIVLLKKGVEQGTIQSQVITIVIIAIVLIIIAGVLVFILSNSMAARMIAIRDFLEKLADGELDAEIEEKQMERHDELGEIYCASNDLREHLIKVVTDIKSSSDNLMDSANILTQMSVDTKNTMDGVVGAVDGISQGAMTQAENSATANENIVRISEQIDHITQEVENLTAFAQKMNEDEKASEKIIEELNVSNEETKESIGKVSEQIDIMHMSIRNIQKAVSSIKSIAYETDLLSLNARIEAARAGEAGRGFTVVSEQICKLAEQSNQSAKDIEKIIAGFMETSQKMVSIMDEVRMNMNHQQDKLEETKVKYTNVSKGVENSLNNIEKIKAEMGVLSESRDAVKNLVEDLAAISEENAASSQSTMDAAQGMTTTMEQLQEASEKLLGLSDTLKEGLELFKM